MAGKVCFACKIEKELSEYNKCSKKSDGVYHICRECSKSYGRLAYSKNKETRKKSYREYYNKNKDKIRAINKNYYEKNKDSLLITYKKYRERNADACRKREKEYRIKNRESVNKTIQNWHKANPEFRKRTTKMQTIRRRNDPVLNMAHRIRTMTRLCLLKDHNGKLATERLGIEPKILRTFMQLTGGMAIDHICPLSQARTVEEVIKLAHYSNLQVIPYKENAVKNTKKTKNGEYLCEKLLNRKWIDREEK